LHSCLSLLKRNILFRTVKYMAKKNPSYKEAIAEIEEILREIENEETDVDHLAEKVKRAYSLLKLCREKLYKTEKEIDNIMKEMRDEE